jgi:hypothetical protein
MAIVEERYDSGDTSQSFAGHDLLPINERHLTAVL